MKAKKKLTAGVVLIILFVLFTIAVMNFDVQALGQKGTDIGFATLNTWFHSITGVNMTLYNITDWMGVVPLLVCFIFAGVGLVQLIKRKSLLKVDGDILILGVYYIVVVLCYFVFECIPINYRPVLINGFLEVSYPSSTTLLVLCVMPTLSEQANRRLKNNNIRNIIKIFVVVFSAFMVVGRLVCGVHWLTDVVGSVILCAGLYNIYASSVLLCYNKEK